MEFTFFPFQQLIIIPCQVIYDVPHLYFQVVCVVVSCTMAENPMKLQDRLIKKIEIGADDVGSGLSLTVDSVKYPLLATVANLLQTVQNLLDRV